MDNREPLWTTGAISGELVLGRLLCPQNPLCSRQQVVVRPADEGLNVAVMGQNGSSIHSAKGPAGGVTEGKNLLKGQEAVVFPGDLLRLVQDGPVLKVVELSAQAKEEAVAQLMSVAGVAADWEGCEARLEANGWDLEDAVLGVKAEVRARCADRPATTVATETEAPPAPAVPAGSLKRRPDGSLVTAGSVVSELTVLSWNVWFEEYQFESRAEALISRIAAHRPDVIALQEVLEPFWRRLAACPWHAEYKWAATGLGYFAVLGVKAKLKATAPKIARFQNSAMGRGIVTSTITLASGDTLAVGTSHLESLPAFSQARKEQLVTSLLTHLGPSVATSGLLIGDMNWIEKSDGQLPGLLATTPGLTEWRDLWADLHPDKDGFTYDYKNNQMIKGHFRSRLDRAIFRPGPGISIANINLVGQDTIGTDATTNKPFWCSDHWGLRLAMNELG